MKYLVLLSLACSVLGDAEPQYGYAGAGLLPHHYGAAMPYAFQPGTLPTSAVDTPASTLRLTAPQAFSGYGHTLPYGYAGYAGYPGYAHPGYAHPGYAHPGYAHPGYAFPGWNYTPAAAEE